MMKNIFVLLILSIVLFSCEKENDTKMQDKLQNQKTQVLDEMSELEADINDFLQKIDDEEEGSLPLDSAVYYLEAGFNYRYANSGRDEELVATQVDTFFVDIVIDEDECTYTEMNETFGYIFTEVSSLFEDINFDNKALHIVDVEYAEELTNKFRVISLMKYARLNDVGDWFWGNNQGPCSGSGPALDATDFIERISETEYWSPLPYGIWTNINFTPKFCPEDVKPNPYGYWNTYLFGADGVCNPCLTHEEIDYYAENLTAKTNILIDRYQITQSINKKLLFESIVPGGPSGGSNFNGPHHCLKLVIGDHEDRILSGESNFLMN